MKNDAGADKGQEDSMTEKEFFELEEMLTEMIAKYKSFCEQEGLKFKEQIKTLIDRASE